MSRPPEVAPSTPSLSLHAEWKSDRRVRTRRIAILGNPNAGKSTLFNRLTGLRQKVGNYPGVTVEKKTGVCDLPSGVPAELIDLPGSYSLQPASPDERIVRDILLGLQPDTPPPDLIIFVVDATHLERHLNLALQITELGRPVVLALNMMDSARAAELDIDVESLQRGLGVPVVPISAARGEGLGSLRRIMEREVEPSTLHFREWPPFLQRVLDRLAARLPRHAAYPDRARRDIAFALLLDDGEDDTLVRAAPPELLDDAAAEARNLDKTHPGWRHQDVAVRFETIREILSRALLTPGDHHHRGRDTLDRILTHRVFGPAIFLILMGAVFQSVFAWALPLMDLIDVGVGAAGRLIEASIPPGALRSLLVDGVIAGVGTTITFVPQIAILFFFLSMLEDTGYMARAAFIMDRLMGHIGLSGRSFIPLLSSFACAIPGIMATRTIDNRRDRITTMIVAPFMSCSARLPVYALLIGAFIPNRWIGFLTLPGLTLISMYSLGIAAAIVVAFVLKRTVLAGPTPLYIMELPPYRVPSWRSVLQTVYERSWLFVRNAGTVILAITILLWFFASYPKNGPEVRALSAERAEAVTNGSTAQIELLDRRISASALEHSTAGKVGRFLEPVIAPLGFDWRIGIALVTSFAAREVMVSTMATMFNLSDAREDVVPLRTSLREAIDPETGRRAYSTLTGISLMVFFVLACQCMSTVAVVRRETNSWRWPIFMLVLMNVMAWLASFAIYQGGRWLGFGT
ncbi:MAG: ferrous iron transport protein B [Candidatus Eisenbacteria bacterium]|nr:ferrous iron transport protein B [Candidatus Eisenbacteria bacterium]